MSNETIESQREFEFSERDFRRVCSLIHARAGIALADSKRDMVYSRISRRLRALGLENFADYLNFLERDGDGGDEWQSFVNALTTNLTSFFREEHHFDHLRQHLPSMRKPGGNVQIWCSAASTGEEPYSIAIAACEAFGTLSPPVSIIATDIDTQVLATAERGVYPLERIERLSSERKRSFFQRGTGANSGKIRINPALKALINFAPLNLLHESYGLRGPFAAIFCRNVMIYFDNPTQRKVLERMHAQMKPGALLYVGHSENFTDSRDLFRLRGKTIYERV